MTGLILPRRRFLAAAASFLLLSACAGTITPRPLQNRADDLGCEAVAVAPDIIATAAHCLPGNIADLRYRPAAARAEAVLAQGGAGRRGADLTLNELGRDWALVRVTTATPLPVLAIDQHELATRLRDGAALEPACRLNPQSWTSAAFTLLDCPIKQGQSGSAVLLVENGRRFVVGILVGFDGDTAVAARATQFAPMLSPAIAEVP